MAVIFEYCADVDLHVVATGTVFIIPVKVGAGVLHSVPFSGDGVVLFKDKVKVFGVEFLNILDAKIIYYKKKHDRVSFVQPQARGGGFLIVASGSKAFAEEVVG